jgi:hypothetical protein
MRIRDVNASPLTRGTVLLALSTIYLAYVFRLPTGEWRRMGLGDWLDPYFINALLEHWRYSVTHLTSPASPPVFFPVRGTLGYSHSLMLYAPFYVVARLWLHPFIAYTVTLFAIIEIGTACLYVLFRRFVGLTFAESLIVVAVFATSGNVINGATGVWSQRASIFLVPPILLLGLWSTRCAHGRLRWVGLAASGALGASLFTHDIYTGLLTAVVAVPLVIGARLILSWPRPAIRITLYRRQALPMTVARRSLAIGALVVMILSLAIAWQHKYGDIRHRHPGRALAVAAIALALFELARGGTRDRVATTNPSAVSDAAALTAGVLAGVVFFVWVYSPAFSQYQGFPAQDLLNQMRSLDPDRWRQMLTSPGMLVPYDTGRTVAMVFVVGAAAWLPWLGIPRRIRLYALWFMMVTVVLLAVPVRVGGIALWSYAFETLPGFSAIRDPRRIQYPFELAAALGIALLVAQFPRASLRRRSVTLLVLVVVLAKWNWERFDYERPFDSFRQFVEAPIFVDSSCRSFFVKRAESLAYLSRSKGWATYASDAAFIATRTSIPTLNGYSAWTPPDWHLFNPQDSDYLPGVAQWVSLNGLEHVCELDIDRRTMMPRSATAASAALPR